MLGNIRSVYFRYVQVVMFYQVSSVISGFVSLVHVYSGSVSFNKLY